MVRFASLTQSAPGGLLRFDDVSHFDLMDVLEAVPEDISEQASGSGPRLATMMELAERLGGSLGGFLSEEDRDDVVFFFDTLVLPSSTDKETLDSLDADEVSRTSDGRCCLWWD